MSEEEKQDIQRERVCVYCKRHVFGKFTSSFGSAVVVEVLPDIAVVVCSSGTMFYEHAAALLHLHFRELACFVKWLTNREYLNE